MNKKRKVEIKELAKCLDGTRMNFKNKILTKLENIEELKLDIKEIDDHYLHTYYNINNNISFTIEVYYNEEERSLLL